ncbi:MAG: SpoIIE family protein phosphatase [Bacteroidetes bacterium]|nr:SpoIIE family protein phosphatase [Bacteroidota bacterium]
MKNPSSKKKPAASKNNLLKRLNFFEEITQKIFEKKPLEKLLDEIISTSKMLLNAEASSLLLYDKNGKSLTFHTVAGEKKRMLQSRTIQLGQGLGGWVAKHKKPLVISDCYRDERFNKEFDLKTGFKTRNMICVPMVRKKELIGVIQTMNKRGRKSFTNEDLKLFEALAAQCAVAIENARLFELEIKSEQLRYELETARNIQTKLIPQTLPVFSDLQINARLIPAREVGGDYFNIIKIDEHRTLFLVADVTGKSIPAALIVSTVYSFLQTYLILNRPNFELMQFVESLNKFLIQSTGSDKFVTAWFGLYDHSSREMKSINAGHDPVYLLKENLNDITEISAGGLMLGSIELPYNYETIRFGKNDLLIFYTDGIPEAMNLRSEEFGDERFKNILLGNKNEAIENISSTVLNEIKKHRGKAEQSDDITLGIIRVK